MMSKEAITERFPHKSIVEINGKPDQESILRVIEALTENLAPFPRVLGGSSHGISGIIISDAKYHRDTGHDFVYPVVPPLLPDFTGATSMLAKTRVKD